MTGRIPFGLLTLLTVLACVPTQAQDPMGPPPGFGVQPAGFQAYQPYQQPDAPGQYQPMPYGYQPDAMGNPQGHGGRQPGPTPRTIFEELPDDPGFLYDDTPLGKILLQTIKRSWFRSEYVIWSATAPGAVLLGEQPLGGIPHTPTNGEGNAVPITPNLSFPRSVDGVTGIATAPTLDGVGIGNLNGFRGTYGIPLPSGQFEVSAFVFSKSSDSITGADYIQGQVALNQAATVGGKVGTNGLPATNQQTAQFITQPVFVNGAPTAISATSAGINYDVSYQATLSTSTWGTEANYLFEVPDPTAFFQMRPSIGFRYFNYRDRLDQFGQYNVTTATSTGTSVTTVNNRSINSGSNNNLWGPQLGLRAEVAHQYFVLGVEPKIMFAANSWNQGLNTNNVFGPTDRPENLGISGTAFSPLFDAKFYANVNLSKNVSWYVSYNFIYVNQINHSYNGVVYNQNAIGQSDFHLNQQFSTSTLQGISFGFDCRF